jgi:N-acetylglucosaminylphosphatidylinositol deacetylase family protein
MPNKVLVVAAHPDDEVLGVGGTIIRHAEQGDCIKILLMAEGLTSRKDKRDTEGFQKELDALHRQAQSVARILGADEIRLCNFPDNRMDGIERLDIIKPIEHLIDEFHPNIVYTHHAGDVNVDHFVTHEAVVTATRSVPGQFVKEIYFFETLSSTEWQMQTADRAFLPTLFVDIESVFERKMEALNLYDSEMREYPHPRSYRAVKSLAEYRGCTSGVHMSEAFSIGRIIR